MMECASLFFFIALVLVSSCHNRIYCQALLNPYETSSTSNERVLNPMKTLSEAFEAAMMCVSRQLCEYFVKYVVKDPYPMSAAVRPKLRYKPPKRSDAP